MERKYIDCRDVPNKEGCTLKISGQEEEVVKTATDHAIKVHGETDTPELKTMIRNSLKVEKEEPMETGRPQGQRVEEPRVQH